MTIQQYLNDRIASNDNYAGLVRGIRSGGVCFPIPPPEVADYETFIPASVMLSPSNAESYFLIGVSARTGMASAQPIILGDRISVYAEPVLNP